MTVRIFGLDTLALGEIGIDLGVFDRLLLAEIIGKV